MINDANKSEVIEQYLQGQLSGELLAAFKEKLSADPEFKKEVALTQAIVRNLKTVGKRDFLNKLEGYHRGIDATGTHQTPPTDTKAGALDRRSSNQDARRLVWLVAAGVALLLLSTVAVINYLGKSTHSEELVAAYFEPYPNVASTTNRAPGEPVSEVEAALQAYDKGDFARSISLFQKMLAKGENEIALFYLGNAYLATSQPKQSTKVFADYLAKYREFDTEAQWYLSLSYLQEERKAEAIALLRRLAQEKTDYTNKATQLLRELETTN